MNKTELIGAVAEKAQLAKKDAEKAVNAFFATVEDALKAGDKVQIVGFGTFEVRERKERTGRNPQTGEEMKIEASKSPAFKPGKAFKDLLQNNGE
ncbi:HU family DNA-binding protein [Heliophilum fasciatum]|uniref:Nucleoid protein Hbs n=1 Tax=Heliophilum fasciatum TaxID=35700 RepID=A0A4R2RY52_9FIRM|nr:HU family DNA-binding protein [Heliophilum fasciatum]MCW2277030.1 DNA-binding protein HU-beta [Heliophilum fasciatum]TCP68444.1 nucleoid protein Hbs [Heliophilum fasciatum]